MSDAGRILLMGDARQIHLTRWQRYLSDHGYDVLTVSLEPLDDIAGPGNHIYIPGVLPGFIRYPAAVPQLKKIIGRFRPHLVNAHFLPNYGTMAMMSGFHPWILSTWGSDIMLVPHTSSLHMLRTRRVIASADYITSDAEVMSRKIVEFGAPPDRVITFPFGIDRTRFYPPEAQPDRSGPRILSNRKLEAVYSIETVIAAFPIVRRTHPHATLTVAGSGSLEERLRSAAARVVPGSIIRFVGSVDHDDMPGLLRDHDIYVSMSLSDTTSVSLLEAMASGLFPVVSDIPANREWIDHGVNGLLVAVRNETALAAAIEDAWRAPHLRATARERNLDIIRERANWTDNMALVGDVIARALHA